MQIKVVVPKGKYRIDKLLEIYSNTWLYLEDGATIVRNFDKGCMIKRTLRQTVQADMAAREISLSREAVGTATLRLLQDHFLI